MGGQAGAELSEAAGVLGPSGESCGLSFALPFVFWALISHSPRDRDRGRAGQVEEPGKWQQPADSANTSRVSPIGTPCWIPVPAGDCTGLVLSPG